MPLIIPIFTEPEEAEAGLTRFYFAGLFSVTVEGQPSDSLMAAVDVTGEREETVLNAALDAHTGDSIPLIIDLVNEDLR
jgi:hypothetical protein